MTFKIIIFVRLAIGDRRRIQSVSARAVAAGERRCSNFMTPGKQTTENNTIICIMYIYIVSRISLTIILARKTVFYEKNTKTFLGK